MLQVIQTWRRQGVSYSRSGWRPGRALVRIVFWGRTAWNVRSPHRRGTAGSHLSICQSNPTSAAATKTVLP